MRLFSTTAAAGADGTQVRYPTSGVSQTCRRSLTRDEAILDDRRGKRRRRSRASSDASGVCQTRLQTSAWDVALLELAELAKPVEMPCLCCSKMHTGGWTGENTAMPG